MCNSIDSEADPAFSEQRFTPGRPRHNESSQHRKEQQADVDVMRWVGDEVHTTSGRLQGQIRGREGDTVAVQGMECGKKGLAALNRWTQAAGARLAGSAAHAPASPSVASDAVHSPGDCLHGSVGAGFSLRLHKLEFKP